MPRRGFDVMLTMRDDLMKTYREVFGKCRTQKEAYAKVVKHPAPRFYVSPKKAYEVMRFLISGDTSVLENMRSDRKRMYMDMFNVLLRMMQKPEYTGKSLWFVCQFLVTQPAPEFYFSVSSMEDLFSLYRKHGKDFRHDDIYKPHKKVNKPVQ